MLSRKFNKFVIILDYMVYKKIHLYLKPREELDLSKPIFIVKKFLDNIDEKDRKRANFNAYGEQPRRITVRFDLADANTETLAEEIAKNLVKQGIVHSMSPLLDASIDEYIKIAHELASWCALKLSEDSDFLDMHNKIFNGEIDPLKFFNCFLYLLFEKLNFELYFTWEQIAKYKNDIRIDRFASACSQKLTHHRKEFLNPNFLERFIHLLLNCLNLQIMITSNTFNTEKPQPLETIFWMEFTKAQSLKSLAENIKERLEAESG